MKCPFCGGETVTGEVLDNNLMRGPSLYVRKPEDSDRKYFWKMFFGSKDAIQTEQMEGGWYCPACKKLIVVWKEKA